MYKSAILFVFASSQTRVAFACGFFIAYFIDKANYLLKLNIKSDAKQLLKALGDNQKQIRIATSIALTKTAKQVEAEEYIEIKRVFDRPTKYTLTGLFTKPSTKNNLEASVGIKNDVFKGTPAEKYLYPNIVGGGRNIKRFERAFINKGIMPKGYHAVPGSGVVLDSFGNIPAKFIVQLISYLGAFGEQGYRANMTSAGRAKFERAQSKSVAGAATQYFVNKKKGNLPLGVYQRVRLSQGSAIKPIFIFVKQVNYKPRYNFQSKASEIAKKVFPQYLKESVMQSLQYI